jgi:hypothetical protein
MDYPEDLTYFSKKLTGFQREWIQWYPTVSREYNPEDWMEIELPLELLDLSSFRIMGDILGIKENSFDIVNFPRHIESFVEHVEVYINNVQVDSLQFANHLFHMQYPYKNTGNRGVLELDMSYAGLSDGRAAVDYPGRTNAVTRPVPAANFLNSYPFQIRNLPGFMSCGKIIDVPYVGLIRIRIKWATNNVVQGTAEPSFQVQNVHCMISAIRLRDPAYITMMRNLVAEVGIAIPYKRYVCVRAGDYDVQTRVPFAIRTKCLSALHTVFVAGSGEKLNGINGTYFGHSMNGVARMRYELEGRFFPSTFDVSPATAFAITQSSYSEATHDDDVWSGTDVNRTPFDDWRDAHACFCYRFGHSDSLSVMSGIYKPGDEAIQGAFIAYDAQDADPFIVTRPLIFAECHSLVNVGSMRKVTVTL